MKKKTILTIMMVVWVNGMFAQTQEDGDTIIVNAPITELPKEVVTPAPKAHSTIDYEKLAQTLQQQGIVFQNDNENEDTFVEPIQHYRKDKFSKHVHAVQRVGIALIAGTDDDDEETSHLKTNYRDEDDEQEASEDDGQLNQGVSVDYTFGFLFGRTDENNLFYPNKFGFALNTGFVFAFDKQNRYGTTFDFLLKLGFETGYNHPFGLEFDLLFGTGKACGDFSFDVEEDGNIEHREIPYTEWCLKGGFQISVRSNLLHTQVKNTDVRLFVRYVTSRNPKDDAELLKEGIINKWQERGWSIGLLFAKTI